MWKKAHSNAAVQMKKSVYRGKILANLMGHITNDLASAKNKIRRAQEAHEGTCMACSGLFVTEDIDMGGFTMKLLSSKGKPKYRACDTAAAWWWIYGGSAQCILCICRPL